MEATNGADSGKVNEKEIHMVAVAINSIVPSDPSGGLDSTQNELIVEGSLTLSGNYGNHSPANGDTVAFAGDKIKSQQRPRRVEIFQAPTSPAAPVHYSFIYGYGTNALNGVLIVIDTTTGLPLTDAAAYPAALTAAGANVRFKAWFSSFV